MLALSATISATMDCVSCGQHLPDDARFCDQCGTRQPPSEERVTEPRLDTRRPAQAPPDPWAYCEVVATATGSTYAFAAIVTGSGAREVVDTVSKMPHDNPSKINQRFLTQLVTRLIAAGWEPLPTGSAWYALRFRRHEIA
jgi:hypothetical protein